jgi:hypothetical protein
MQALQEHRSSATINQRDEKQHEAFKKEAETVLQLVLNPNNKLDNNI